MAEDINKILSRYSHLKSERANWESLWEECARYGNPRRLGFVGKRTPGERRNQQIYNPIGIACVQTLAAALHGWTMNPASKWMSLRLLDDELNDQDEAKQWLDTVTDRILRALASPQTAFNVHANQILEDMSSIGTAAMYIGQKKTGPLYVRSRTVAEVMIAENNYGAVDTVICQTDYTVRQAMMTWGAKCSDKIRKYWDDGKYDITFPVAHMVKPRDEFDPGEGKGTPKNMPWSVVYFEPQAEHLLEETGSEEMPYVVPRWWVAAGEIYGRSPFMTALPQVKVANAAQKTILEAAEKAINPALQIPHDGVVSPVRTAPGGQTYVRGKDRQIMPMPTSNSLPFAAEWLQAVNNEIRTTMFVDQVQFVGDFKMTATEVMQRSVERMRLLGPVLGRLENEFLNPLITRVFGIMMRSGSLPKPPDSIQGADMRVEYVSPLAKAQKSQNLQSLAMAMQVLAPFAQVNPQAVFAPVDMSKLTKDVFEWAGVDSGILHNTQDEQQNLAQGNQQKMLMQLLPMLQGAAHGGKALQSVAAAGKDMAETNQIVNPPAPPPAGGEGAPGPQGPSPAGSGVAPAQPGPGSLDLMSLLGSLMKGGAQAAPAAVGSPQNLTSALTRH